MIDRTEFATLDDLKSLYHSDLYQGMVTEFLERTRLDLYDDDHESQFLIPTLNIIQENFVKLGIPFYDVQSKFTEWRDGLLDYSVARCERFSHVKNRKSYNGTVSSTYVFSAFGEFYLLKTNNPRLAYFLTQLGHSHADFRAEKLQEIYRESCSDSQIESHPEKKKRQFILFKK